MEDDGVGFNPFAHAAPDTTAATEDRPEGGPGIHIVRNLMEKVGYQRDGEKNVTTLIKRFTTKPERGEHMNFSTRMQDDLTIVDIEGNLDTTTAPTARGGFESLLAECQKTILVNLAKLDYTSSAGLRVLLALAKEL